MLKKTLISNAALIMSVFALGLAMLVGLLAVSGHSWLSLEKILVNLGDQTSLVVESDPSDSYVWINNTYYGATPLETSLVPGNYMLRVQRDGYEPCEKNIEVRDQNTLKIRCRLYSAPELVEIASTVSALFWAPSGNLLYFNYLDSAFYEYSQGIVKLLPALADSPSIIAYSSDGKEVLVLSQSEYFSALHRVDLLNGNVENLETVGLPHWGIDADRYYVLSEATQSGLTIWRHGRSHQEVEFSDLPSSDVINFWISKSETVIVLQEDNQISYWQGNKGAYDLIQNMQGVYGLDWLKNGEDFLSINSNNQLCRTKLMGGSLLEECLTSKVMYPLSLSDDRERIYFFTLSNNGSGSLWMLDLQADIPILIATNLLGIGEPIEIAISPNEKQIAILNQFNQLLILNLK